MKYLKHTRAGLVSLAMVCLCIKVIWWTVAPLIPFIVIGILLCTVIAVAVFRTTRL